MRDARQICLLVVAWTSFATPLICSTPIVSAQVLAHVGDETITLADVDFQLGRVGRQAEDLPEIPVAILKSTVDMIASQRQAVASLRKLKLLATDAAVDRWLEANPPPTNNPDVKLSAQEIVSALCNEMQLEERSYRSFLAFRLSWPSYLKKHLTEANVEKHFRKQTARFDGTQFEIEMASLAAPAGESEARNSAEAQLTQIKAENSNDFAGAAKDSPEIELYSQRWIRGSGDLDPSLIDSILKLEKGELSDPIHNATGVHLIRLIDLKPGSLALSEVRDEVRAHMLIFLLKHLASQSAEAMPLKSNL